MNAPEQTLPTLLYLLCAMSAMAFLMSSYLWLWKTARQKHDGDAGFKPAIHKGQLYSFLSVMVLSISIGMYDHYNNESALNISGEICVLVLAIIYAYLKDSSAHKISGILKSVRAVLLFGALCVAGWGITFMLGWLCAYVFYAVGAGNGSLLNTNVVFITGLLWNIPTLLLYANIAKNAQTKDALGGNGFHKYLWPILMAYTVLLIPLLVQQISVSEEWQQMKQEKHIRTV